jgi:hypothetical protein
VGFDVVEVHFLGYLGVVFVKTYHSYHTNLVYLCSYLSMKNGMPHCFNTILSKIRNSRVSGDDPTAIIGRSTSCIYW